MNIVARQTRLFQPIPARRKVRRNAAIDSSPCVTFAKRASPWETWQPCELKVTWRRSPGLPELN